MPQNSGVTPNVTNTVQQHRSNGMASNSRSFVKQRRYTPYRKTPASRLLKGEVCNHSGISSVFTAIFRHNITAILCSTMSSATALGVWSLEVVLGHINESCNSFLMHISCEVISEKVVQKVVFVMQSLKYFISLIACV